MSDVFSYTRQREPGQAGVLFFRFARALYLRRALALALALPFDLAWLAVDACAGRIRGARPQRLLFLTTPPAAWIARLPSCGAAWVGAPHLLLSVLRHGGVYVPASPLYLLLTAALFLPAAWQQRVGQVAVRLFAAQLRLAGIGSGTLVHHSDALPLGRAVVLAAQRLGLTTVCLQHGIFHISSAIAERDGSLSNINVVRSQLDAALIAQSAAATRFLVEPDFFIPRVAADGPAPAGMRITLLGEGWHQCDAAFGARYLDRLRSLEAQLLAAQAEVVFRPHPCERTLAQGFGFTQLDTGPLDACLQRSALVVGYSSTVLHEAASVGVTSAQIDVDGVFNASMDRDGVAVVKAASAADLLALATVAHAPRPTAAQLLERQSAAALRILDTILGSTRSVAT